MIQIQVTLYCSLIIPFTFWSLLVLLLIFVLCHRLKSNKNVMKKWASSLNWCEISWTPKISMIASGLMVLISSVESLILCWRTSVHMWRQLPNLRTMLLQAMKGVQWLWLQVITWQLANQLWFICRYSYVITKTKLHLVKKKYIGWLNCFCGIKMADC